MGAGCRVAARYKNSMSIACAQHAMQDMKPFKPTRKREQVNEESDTEV